MCKKLFLLILLLLVLPFANVAIAGRATLIGWWTFDEGAGNIAADSSGQGNDGTLGGTPRWVTGTLGGALELSGDDYVAIDGVVDDITSTDITLSVWIQSTQTGQGDIIAANNSASSHPLEFYIDGGYPGRYDGSDLNYPDAPLVADGQWHMMTYVREGNEGRIFVDGVLAVTYSSSFSLSGVTRWSIGQEWDDSTPSNFYTGLVDDVRFYDGPLSADHVLDLFNGIEPTFLKALDPDPADGAFVEDTWVNMSWGTGDFAVSHDVYLGPNADEVREGTGDTFQGNQSTTDFIVGFPGFPIPDGLVPGTTYYWRVDEVDESNPDSPWVGDLWSFTMPPRTAYSPDPADGAEFVDLDAAFSWTGGFSAKLHTVYMGTNFDDVSNAAGGAPRGVASYSPGPLELEKVYYWRVDEFDPPFTHKGDVWGFTTPGAVGNPQPANGEADVQMIATLSWTAADNATSHELYFGTDAEAVKNATTASPEYVGPKALGSESHDPGGLAQESSYAWRVDEVYPTGTVKGLVWSFTTADFLLVDDFESYNDIEPPDPASNRIFDKWIDGFGTTTNGALVGNDLPPYAEQTVVHGGAQSLVYRYDNAGKTSEATLTLVWPKDWTAEGVTKLSLWVRGASANAADRLFVALNGTAVVSHDDASATQLRGWNEWVIDLAAFGVDLTNVSSITIGVGTKNSPAPGGGAGTLYFDDIRLAP
jgi:hypothetical protein